MEHKAKSIRPFVGSKNFETSRRFYQDLRFEEVVLAPDFSYFHTAGIGFYLQNAYVKDWIDNSMIFLEVDDVERYWEELKDLNLTEKYPDVRLVPVRQMDWGKECFIHDPSGILWHIGEFNNK